MMTLTLPSILIPRRKSKACHWKNHENYLSVSRILSKTLYANYHWITPQQNILNQSNRVHLDSERAIDSPETEFSGANDGPDPMASTPPASIPPQTPLQVAFNAGQFHSFSYKTSAYQLHYLETPTGWRFILQTPNPPLLHTTSKGTSKQKDMTKMFMSLTLSTPSQSSEVSSIAPSPSLVHVKMELFYELVVEHIIRHPFYILQTGNSVFNRAGFLRIIDSTMQEVAKRGVCSQT